MRRQCGGRREHRLCAIRADAAEAEGLCVRVESAPAGGRGGVGARVKLIAERSARRVAWLAGHPTAAALAHSIEKAQAVLDSLAPEPKAAEPVRIAPAAR